LIHARFWPARSAEGLRPQILQNPRKCDQGPFLIKNLKIRHQIRDFLPFLFGGIDFFRTFAP